MTAPTNVKYDNTGPIQRTQGVLSGTYTAATDVSTTTNAAMAAGVLTLTLGFVPMRFKFQNVTTGIMREWFNGMTAAYGLVTDANGITTYAAAGFTVAERTGTGGSASQAAGSADTSPSGVVTITASGLFTDNDTLVWVAEG